ncbi:MAG: hypothetical protein MHM6MM_007953 [Cercozoa sp. M6MM]
MILLWWALVKPALVSSAGLVFVAISGYNTIPYATLLLALRCVAAFVQDVAFPVRVDDHGQAVRAEAKLIREWVLPRVLDALTLGLTVSQNSLVPATVLTVWRRFSAVSVPLLLCLESLLVLLAVYALSARIHRRIHRHESILPVGVETPGKLMILGITVAQTVVFLLTLLLTSIPMWLRVFTSVCCIVSVASSLLQEHGLLSDGSALCLVSALGILRFAWPEWRVWLLTPLTLLALTSVPHPTRHLARVLALAVLTHMCLSHGHFGSITADLLRFGVFKPPVWSQVATQTAARVSTLALDMLTRTHMSNATFVALQSGTATLAYAAYLYASATPVYM